MKTKEFVTRFNNSKDKEGYIKKHIKTEYISYEEKSGICIKVIERSSFDKEGNYDKNTHLEYLLYMLNIVNSYTDIEIDFKNAVQEMNLLDEKDALNMILSQIPKKELDLFGILLDMARSDFESNYRSISSMIDNLKNTLGYLLTNINIKELIQNFSKNMKVGDNDDKMQ